MTSLDTFVLVAYFVVTLGAGVWFARTSASGLRSYFLGDNQQKWWMLACSGSATNYSVDGTVWMISMLMVLGMKSWWTTLIWWMPSSIVLMSFTAIWIRRTGVMTAAELNIVRFGTDRGAEAARIGFALMITVFSVAQLCMAYVVLHKFATIFGFPGHRSALTVVGVTGLYVMIGGFRGVILTDFIQNVLLVGVSVVIGVICMMHYSATEVHKAVATGVGETAVSTGYWKSLAYDPAPVLGAFEESETYRGWKDFGGAALAWSVVGILGCFGGAGGRYGEQRYLAAANAKQAAWQAGLWSVLALPRWVVVGGLAFLGLTIFRDAALADPDGVYPLFVKSGLLVPGVKGLVIATLAAAYMSTFSSEVNATASMMVNDIWRPVFRRDGGKPRESMLASYLASGLLVCCSMGCGYFFAENSSLNAVWMWMLGGLVACYVIPLALRWYWGRMNGWGFAAGSVAGLVPAFVLLYKGFAAEGAAVRQIPDDVFTYAILTISLLTCVVVSLLTKPVEEKHIDTFSRRVRPFGMWGAVRRRALAPGLPANEPIAFGRAMLNIVLGCIGMYSLYLSPVYLLGRWYGEASLAFGIFAAACVALYFTWLKKLPEK
jgi:Na+/proline symporter